MQLKNIHGLSSIDEYVKWRIERHSVREHTLEALFEEMFLETDNIMYETTDGFRISRTTYGEAKAAVLAAAERISAAVGAPREGERIGIYLPSCPDFITALWGALGAGYSVVLMNTRLTDAVLEGAIKNAAIKAVISDGKRFSVPTYVAEELFAPDAECGVPIGTYPFGKQIAFMSSGTTGVAKLCFYDGESFYHQVCDSARIIESCPGIREHYEGELKHLVLLPLCHVFGFIAVYLWFGFFSRTFVFPRDLNPDTVRATVKKHKVTHIFAVPMVWERVARAARAAIKRRGEGTERRFLRAAAFSRRLPGALADTFRTRAFREIRDGIFGDSVRFLISGGSGISRDAIEFFNTIGYRLANGYGMTEIGITSVETSSAFRTLVSRSVGTPIGTTEYMISDEGELLVRGRTRASAILTESGTSITDHTEWFNTHDRAQLIGGRYYLLGRADDLVVTQSGENIDPATVEDSVRGKNIEDSALVRGEGGEPVLLVSTGGCYVESELRKVFATVSECLEGIGKSGEIRRILLTASPLISGDDFKKNRTAIAKRLAAGELSVVSEDRISAYAKVMRTVLAAEIRACFAEALDREADEISDTAGFFRDLGGTSIDYFALLGLLRSRLGYEMSGREGDSPMTVLDFYVRIAGNEPEAGDCAREA